MEQIRPFSDNYLDRLRTVEEDDYNDWEGSSDTKTLYSSVSDSKIGHKKSFHKDGKGLFKTLRNFLSLKTNKVPKNRKFSLLKGSKCNNVEIKVFIRNNDKQSNGASKIG